MIITDGKLTMVIKVKKFKIIYMF